MEFDRRTSLARTSNAATTNSTLAPGKRTLTEQLPVQRREGATLPGAESGTKAMVPSTPAPLPAAAGSRPTLQMLFGFRPASAEDPAQVHAAAARGTTTPTTELPYADQIQRSFGRHDISGIKAHVGGDAAASARTMGAEAYATGNHVVLGRGTDLHTVAHEAAHVVQQRGGVQLKSGVGEVEDQHEQHADAVADRVARGESTEALLDMYVGERSTPAGPATEGVQRRQIVPDADLRARVRGLPALIDTKTFTAGQLEDLLQLLEDAREDRRIFPATTAGRETFQQLISDITMELVDAIATHDYKRDGAGAQSPSLGSGSLSSSAALSPSLGSGSLSLSPGASALSSSAALSPSLGSGSLSLSPGASALSPDSLFTPAEPKAPQAQAR